MKIDCDIIVGIPPKSSMYTTCTLKIVRLKTRLNLTIPMYTFIYYNIEFLVGFYISSFTKTTRKTMKKVLDRKKALLRCNLIRKDVFLSSRLMCFKLSLFCKQVPKRVHDLLLNLLCVYISCDKSDLR